MIAPLRTEHGEQAALMEWAALRSTACPELALLFAIPNGGLRAKGTAGRLKAEGVKRHVPDLFLPVARRGKHGLFIEMKAEGGYVPEGQRTMLDALRYQGYQAQVCYGFEQARNTLIDYLDLPGE